MDPIDSRYFKSRNSVEGHQSSLQERYPLDKKVDDTLQLAFAHQIAVYKLEGNNRPKKAEPAHYFYHSCYLTHELKLGASGVTKTIPEFIETILGTVPDTGINQVTYLTGPAGSGKTALINRIITVEGKRLVQNRGLWFIRVDVEDLISGIESWQEEGSELILFKFLAVQTLKVVGRNLEELIAPKKISAAQSHAMLDLIKSLQVAADEINLGKIDYNRKDTLLRSLSFAFSEFVIWMREIAGKRLLLILDNIDAVLHTRDRQTFRAGERPADFGAVVAMPRMVKLFEHGNAGLSGLGASILVSMRTDSYEVVSNIGPLSLPRENVKRFNLKQPDLALILKSRFHFLDYLWKQEGIDNPNLLNLSKSLSEVFLGDRGAALHIAGTAEELLNRSLRDFMEFLRTMATIIISHEDGVKRVLKSKASSTLLILLLNFRMYSQLRCRFPNIYLCVMQERSGMKEGDHYHPHTYWLKRLILQYLVNEAGSPISPTDVVQIFSPHGGGGYPRKVVEECLGSMGEAKGSRIHRRVLVETLEGEACTRIEILPRAIYFSKELIDEFPYLQLIVDDFMMPLPFKDPYKTMQDFSFVNWPDYSYLIARDSGEHAKGTKEMVSFKGQRVLWFLDVIEGAFNAERKIYSKVFQELSDRGIEVPTVVVIRRGVVKWISDLNQNSGRVYFDAEGFYRANLARSRATVSYVEAAMLEADRVRRAGFSPEI